MVGPASDRTVIFTYGTLKRGFSNHRLMQDLIAAGDATFVAAGRTCDPFPLVCGPYRVPFLLNLPGHCGGHRVRGEIYAVTSRALSRMDDLEGVSRGHYERLPIKIRKDDDDNSGDGEVIEGEAYYAHRNYAEELWRRSGEKGLGVYSEKEAIGYVKRTDRPQDISFLDQIRIFVASKN